MFRIQLFFRQPEGLPSEIYGTVIARADVIQNANSCIGSLDTNCQTVPVPADTSYSFIPFESTSVPKQDISQLQVQAEVCSY